jgi:hypothetical protein
MPGSLGTEKHISWVCGVDFNRPAERAGQPLVDRRPGLTAIHAAHYTRRPGRTGTAAIVQRRGGVENIGVGGVDSCSPLFLLHHL